MIAPPHVCAHVSSLTNLRFLHPDSLLELLLSLALEVGRHRGLGLGCLSLLVFELQAFVAFVTLLGLRSDALVLIGTAFLLSLELGLLIVHPLQLLEISRAARHVHFLPVGCCFLVLGSPLQPGCLGGGLVSLHLLVLTLGLLAQLVPGLGKHLHLDAPGLVLPCLLFMLALLFVEVAAQRVPLLLVLDGGDILCIR